MEKDFAGWHTRNTQLDALKSVRYFREQEIWWAAMGHNIGNEMNGKGPNYARPILIFCKFNQRQFLGLPFSTTSRTGKFYYPLQLAGKLETLLLSHIREYDAKRLLEKIRTISQEDYEISRTKFGTLIGIL